MRDNPKKKNNSLATQSMGNNALHLLRNDQLCQILEDIFALSMDPPLTLETTGKDLSSLTTVFLMLSMNESQCQTPGTARFTTPLLCPVPQ